MIIANLLGKTPKNEKKLGLYFRIIFNSTKWLALSGVNFHSIGKALKYCENGFHGAIKSLKVNCKSISHNFNLFYSFAAQFHNLVLQAFKNEGLQCNQS